MIDRAERQRRRLLIQERLQFVAFYFRKPALFVFTNEMKRDAILRCHLRRSFPFAPVERKINIFNEIPDRPWSVCVHGGVDRPQNLSEFFLRLGFGHSADASSF